MHLRVVRSGSPARAILAALALTGLVHCGAQGSAKRGVEAPPLCREKSGRPGSDILGVYCNEVR
jgi:hypothetical protein